MGLARFALRNLVRRKGRLAIVAVLVGGPFFLLLIMQAVGVAVERHTDLLKRSVDTALQLRARGSMGHVNMVGSSTLLPGDVLATIKQVDHVAKVEPYLLAMTPTGGHNFAMIVGVNPGDAKRLESHGEAGNPKIVAGRDLTPDDRGQAVAVIGQGYARALGITPENYRDATVTLDLTRTHPAIFGLDRPTRTLQVVGVYASGYVFGDLQLFMPLDTFRDLYGVGEAISWVFVTADSVDHVAAIHRQLRALVGDRADIIAPEQAAVFASTTARAVVRLAAWGTGLAAALMVLVVFFVMLMVVRERAWEVGTLKALGAPTGGLIVGFVTEALALCAMGAVLGTILFAAAGARLAPRLFAVGIGPFLAAHYQDTLFDTLTLTSLTPATVTGLLAVCLLVAGVGSAYSLIQLVRLSPLEAMRHE